MTDYTAREFFIKPSRSGARDFEALIARQYQVSITGWLRKGWELFKQDAGPAVIFLFAALVIYTTAGWLTPFGIGGMLVSLPLMAGLMIVSLMLCRNQKPDTSCYFRGLRHAIPLLLFTAVSALFIFIGMMLLVVPGLYLTVAYMFAPWLIVDKNIDFWPAMEVSRQKVNKNLFGLFGFFAVLSIINLLGCIPLLLGLFITIPLSVYAMSAAYEDLFAEENRQAGT
jgi:hypothetical protein